MCRTAAVAAIVVQLRSNGLDTFGELGMLVAEFVELELALVDGRVELLDVHVVAADQAVARLVPVALGKVTLLLHQTRQVGVRARYRLVQIVELNARLLVLRDQVNWGVVEWRCRVGHIVDILVVIVCVSVVAFFGWPDVRWRRRRWRRR